MAHTDDLTGLINRRAWDLELSREIAAQHLVERLRAVTPGGESCSAGLACWDGYETADALLGRADAALYDAKQRGRDRTVVA